MMRDHAISASVEAGVNSLRQDAPPQAPKFGYGPPKPLEPQGNAEQRLRKLIDESLLHLSAVQRDAVFAGMQKVLRDPQYAQHSSQILAEFTSTALALREGYLQLDRLSYSQKKALVLQARKEFQRLSAGERQHLLEVLQAGMLPVPRDISEIMLAEFDFASKAAGTERRPD
ncbi:MAG: hypothetical protein HYU73_20850 [Betaproteobacteria bacterium]|nr:hypothetical protein [Betaproteobacteria bacterium]